MAKSLHDAQHEVYLVINAQVFPIQENVVRIGRKLDNDVVIQDALISRYHAEIRLAEDGTYKIFDLGSTSGTFLNNKQVKESTLFSGDIILFANVPVMFVSERKDLDSKGEADTGKLLKG